VLAGCGQDEPLQSAGFDVLVFTKTEGFRHESIADGVKAIRELGDANGFTVTHTEDPAELDAIEEDVVVFLSTTQDVLDAPQEAALESFVREGGGWVGVHAAADTEYDWPFYATLLGGARFESHPRIQEADIEVEDRTHPSTRHLRMRWTRTDEWYAFRENPRAQARILLRLDDSSYDPGDSGMGAEHPIAWCRDVGRGRAFYTGLGHTRESWSEPAFRRHLLGGILSAAGREPADCTPRERDGPRVEAPFAIERRALRRRGLPVRVSCPRGCIARLRLVARGRALAARVLRVRRGAPRRLRLRARRGRRVPGRIRLVADVKPDGRAEQITIFVAVTR
jgi:type 1 glutamine amidotransferase